MAPYLADTASPTGSPASLSPVTSAPKPIGGNSAASAALPEPELARSSSGGWQPWQGLDSTGSSATAMSANPGRRARSPMAMQHAAESAFTSSSESESDASETEGGVAGSPARGVNRRERRRLQRERRSLSESTGDADIQAAAAASGGSAAQLHEPLPFPEEGYGTCHKNGQHGGRRPPKDLLRRLSFDWGH